VKWELYDLAADPAEKSDVATSQAARVQAMQAKLDDWLKSVVGSLNGADYPAKKPGR